MVVSSILRCALRPPQRTTAVRVVARASARRPHVAAAASSRRPRIGTDRRRRVRRVAFQNSPRSDPEPEQAAPAIALNICRPLTVSRRSCSSIVDLFGRRRHLQDRSYGPEAPALAPRAATSPRIRPMYEPGPTSARPVARSDSSAVSIRQHRRRRPAPAGPAQPQQGRAPPRRSLSTMTTSSRPSSRALRSGRRRGRGI